MATNNQTKQPMVMVTRSGADIAVLPVGKCIDSSANNPIDAMAQWRAGQLQPWDDLDKGRMPFKTKVATGRNCNIIAPRKQSDLDVGGLLPRSICKADGVRTSRRPSMSIC